MSSAAHPWASGACVVLSSQPRQGPLQTELLGRGDLAGLQVDQRPAAVSHQDGCQHLRLLDPTEQPATQAGLWRNLWMTCAYTPLICGRRGDNAVDFRKAAR